MPISFINPVAALVGDYIARTYRGYSQKELAYNLGIKDSTFSDLKSGKNLMSLNIAARLLALPSYRHIRSERLSQLLFVAHHLEEMLFESSSIEDALQEIERMDTELIKVFPSSELTRSVLLNKEKRENYFSNEETQEKIHTYLTTIRIPNVLHLENQMRDSIESLSCLLEPLIGSRIIDFESRLQVIKEIDQLNEAIKEFEYEGNKYTMTRDDKRNPRGSNVLALHKNDIIEIAAVVHLHDKLRQRVMMERFQDLFLPMMKQSHFEKITYYVVTEDINELFKTVQLFIQDVREYCNVKNPKLLEYIDRIRFARVDPKHAVIESEEFIGCHGYDEVWLYKSNKYRFTFRPDPIEHEEMFIAAAKTADNEKDIRTKLVDRLSFDTSTIRQAREDWETVNMLKEVAEQIPLPDK